MKYKMSISLDSETVAVIQSMLRTSNFRNKSHVVEHAVKSFYKND